LTAVPVAVIPPATIPERVTAQFKIKRHNILYKIMYYVNKKGKVFVLHILCILYNLTRILVKKTD
jgi:hypothetical protein